MSQGKSQTQTQENMSTGNPYWVIKKPSPSTLFLTIKLYLLRDSNAMKAIIIIIFLHNCTASGVKQNLLFSTAFLLDQK